MRKTELYRHVLDELPVAAYVKSEDLTFEFVNKAWTDLTGISKEQASGRTDRDFFAGGGRWICRARPRRSAHRRRLTRSRKH